MYYSNEAVLSVDTDVITILTLNIHQYNEHKNL
jgi:hypothetical protein